VWEYVGGSIFLSYDSALDFLFMKSYDNKVYWSLNNKTVRYQTMIRRRWTVQEETELKALTEGNVNVEEIAVKLQKSPGAVIVKCQRLGLQLQVKGYVDTTISLPRDLPSIEEAIKMLAGALKASVKPGLNRLEVQRLQAVATISKAYKELVVDYAHYHDVELKLKEMEEQNAQLRETLKEIKERSSNPAPRPVSS